MNHSDDAAPSAPLPNPLMISEPVSPQSNVPVNNLEPATSAATTSAAVCVSVARCGPVPDALTERAEEILRAAENKIPGGAAHARLVSEAATAVGVELGLQDDHLILLGCAGLLHDIGCVDWPAQLLSKPGRWNNDDVTRAQHHPVSGASMLSDAGELKGIGLWIRQHHERPDGSGYPDSLSAEQLSEEGRLLAVVEVFAACVSLRPFRNPLSPMETVARLKGESLGSDDPHSSQSGMRASAGADRFEGAALDPAFIEALLATLAHSMPGTSMEQQTAWPADGLAFDSPIMRRALRETFRAIAASLMSSYETHAGYDAAQELQRELNRRFLASQMPVRFSTGDFQFHTPRDLPAIAIAEMARRAMTVQAEHMDALLLPTQAARLRDSVHACLTPWGQELADRYGLFDGLALSYPGATPSASDSLASHAVATSEQMTGDKAFEEIDEQDSHDGM